MLSFRHKKQTIENIEDTAFKERQVINACSLTLIIAAGRIMDFKYIVIQHISVFWINISLSLSAQYMQKLNFKSSYFLMRCFLIVLGILSLVKVYLNNVSSYYYEEES